MGLEWDLYHGFACLFSKSTPFVNFFFARVKTARAVRLNLGDKMFLFVPQKS